MFVYKSKKISKNRVFLSYTKSPEHFYIINKADMSSSSDEIIEISELNKKLLFLNTKINVKSYEFTINSVKNVINHSAKKNSPRVSVFKICLNLFTFLNSCRVKWNV